jgi:hypothetical protein
MDETNKTNKANKTCETKTKSVKIKKSYVDE